MAAEYSGTLHCRREDVSYNWDNMAGFKKEIIFLDKIKSCAKINTETETVPVPVKIKIGGGNALGQSA